MPIHRFWPPIPAPASAGLACVVAVALGLGPGAEGVSPSATAGEPFGSGGSTPGRLASVESATSDDDLRLFEEMLVDPSVPDTFRREAAIRIARTGTDEAAEILGRSIEAGDEARRGIVTDAIKAAGPVAAPVTRMIAEAVADERLTPELAAAVLTISGEVGTTEVVDLYRSATDLRRRRRLIDVLGRLPDPMAAGALVAAIQVESDAEETAAIDAALQRWSNSQVSRTPAAWNSWWNPLNVGGDGAAALQRLTNRIGQEAARADAEAARADAAQKRAEALASRLVETLGTLLAMLPEEARLEQVQAMLVDDEVRIRTAAIGQIERMLRDARVLPDGMRRALLDRLADVDPAIRIKAAKVLDTSGVDELGPALVRLLEGEADPEVVRAGLLVLGNQPQPVAADFAVRRLASDDPETMRLAARVLATLSGSGLLHPDDRDRIRRMIAEGLEIKVRETARLAVMVAEDPDADAVTSLLVSPLEAVQRGAAEAYRTRGRRELLHRHAASSPIVARAAVQAWANPEGGVDARSVERLLELRPTSADGNVVSADLEADLATWRAAMGRVLEAMPGSQLVATAERLRGERDFIEARIAALRRGTDDATLATVERLSLHRHLAETLIEAGRPGEAASELRAAGADEADSPLRGELFDLLLLAAEWAEAAAVEPEVGPWLAALDRRLAAGDPSAEAILAEIERRFGERLEVDDRDRLDGVRNRVATELDESDSR